MEQSHSQRKGVKGPSSPISKIKVRGPQAAVLDLRFKSNGWQLAEEVEIELRESIELLTAQIKRDNNYGSNGSVDPSTLHANMAMIGHPTPEMSTRWSHLASRPDEESYQPANCRACLGSDFEAHIRSIEQKISDVNNELQGEEPAQCVPTPPSRWLSALDEHLESCEKAGLPGDSMQSWDEGSLSSNSLDNFLAWSEEQEPVDPELGDPGMGTMQWDRLGSDFLFDAISKGTTRTASQQ